MTADSSASQSMRLPALGISGSAAISAQPETTQRTPHPSLAPAVSAAPAAGPPAAGHPASAPAQAKPAASGFLVQQPSSKLWMEAVPMRCVLSWHAELSTPSKLFFWNLLQHSTACFCVGLVAGRVPRA